MRRRLEKTLIRLGWRIETLLVIWPQPSLRPGERREICLLVGRSRRWDPKKWYFCSEKHYNFLIFGVREDVRWMQHNWVHNLLEGVERIHLQFTLYVQPAQWSAHYRCLTIAPPRWLLRSKNSNQIYLSLFIFGIHFGVRLPGNHEVFEVFQANGLTDMQEDLV